MKINPEERSTKYLYYGLITIGLVSILNKASGTLFEPGTFMHEAGFMGLFIGLYFGASAAAVSEIILGMGALWLFLGLAIKYDWFHVRERVSKKLVLTVLFVFGLIIILPLVLGLFGKTHDGGDTFTYKDQFELNKECATYREEAIKQTVYNFPRADYKVQEIFYSPALSTCVYRIFSLGNTNSTTNYYDVLTGNSLYHSFSTLGIPYYDKDGKEVKSMNSLLNNLREDFLMEALKTNSKNNFKIQIQNYMGVEGSEEYQLDDIIAIAKKWFE